MRESVRDGRSLYTVDAELIEALAPDLIVTQDLCAVCAVSSGQLATACPVGAEVLSLDPRTLAEVAESVRTLAASLGAVDRGEEIVAQMWETIERPPPRCEGLPRRRVFFAEWIEPPFCAGHWLPEMIELAGGTDVLGKAGEPSYPTTWDEVIAREPELVVIAPVRVRRRRGRRARRRARAALPRGRGRRGQLLLAAGAAARRRRPRSSRISSIRRPPPDPGLPAIVLSGATLSR